MEEECTKGLARARELDPKIVVITHVTEMHQMNTFSAWKLLDEGKKLRARAQNFFTGGLWSLA
eukprot:COSAG02_NODE_14978_length_1218_cov_1.301162_1_plen_62_part_10